MDYFDKDWNSRWLNYDWTIPSDPPNYMDYLKIASLTVAVFLTYKMIRKL